MRMSKIGLTLWINFKKKIKKQFNDCLISYIYENWSFKFLKPKFRIFVNLFLKFANFVVYFIRNYTIYTINIVINII